MLLHTPHSMPGRCVSVLSAYIFCVSRIFHPCSFVPHFHVSQFHVPHFQRPLLAAVFSWVVSLFACRLAASRFLLYWIHISIKLIWFHLIWYLRLKTMDELHNESPWQQKYRSSNKVIECWRGNNQVKRNIIKLRGYSQITLSKVRALSHTCICGISTESYHSLTATFTRWILAEMFDQDIRRRFSKPRDVGIHRCMEASSCLAAYGQCRCTDNRRQRGLMWIGFILLHRTKAERRASL